MKLVPQFQENTGPYRRHRRDQGSAPGRSNGHLSRAFGQGQSLGPYGQQGFRYVLVYAYLSGIARRRTGARHCPYAGDLRTL
jgi:hypothetical protein